MREQPWRWLSTEQASEKYVSEVFLKECADSLRVPGACSLAGRGGWCGRFGCGPVTKQGLVGKSSVGTSGCAQQCLDSRAAEEGTISSRKAPPAHACCAQQPLRRRPPRHPAAGCAKKLGMLTEDDKLPNSIMLWRADNGRALQITSKSLKQYSSGAVLLGVGGTLWASGWCGRRGVGLLKLLPQNNVLPCSQLWRSSCGRRAVHEGTCQLPRAQAGFFLNRKQHWLPSYCDALHWKASGPN